MVGDTRLAAGHEGIGEGEAVRVSLRPEKITLAEPGAGVFAAEVAAAVFHGSHWLYKLDSPIGELLAVAPNIGGAHWQAGTTVSIGWAEDALRVLRAEDHHG